jgi:hypothetical protein
VSVPARWGRVVLAVLAVALLASACVGAGSSGIPGAASPPAAPGASSPSLPSRSTPSSSAGPSASAESADPSPSSTPPAVVDDTLVARIFAYPDVTAGRVPPMLSVYADGRVLSPSWNADGGFELPFVVRRLTPAGLADLRASLEAAGFFGGDVEIPPVQVTNSGFTTYVVSLRRDDELVTARTTNFAMSDRGRALVDLAERWMQPERELPEEAWLPGQARYEGSRWYVWLRLVPGVTPETTVDSAPLEAAIGDLATFGAVQRLPGDGSIERCGSVEARVVGRFIAALDARGADLGEAWRGQLMVDLRGTGGRGTVALGAFEMLPDDPLVCPADLWP